MQGDSTKQEADPKKQRVNIGRSFTKQGTRNSPQSFWMLQGKVQQYIKPGNVILTAPAAGRTTYGAVTQVEQNDGQFHTYTGSRVPKYLSSAEGNTRTLTLTSCPLLMPNNKDAFIVAKVLEGE